jgi:undecaprenyl-diphosphatase
MLAIPAVLGSGLLEALDISSDKFVNWPATLVATIISFAVGYLAISTFMNYLKTKSFRPFVIYRLALGSLVLVLLATGIISN